MITGELKNKIDNLWDIFASGGLVNPLEVIEQITYLMFIVEYIVHNGMMKDLSVLQESPFTDRGSVVEIFTDLSVWMGIRKVIDMINANAVA